MNLEGRRRSTNIEDRRGQKVEKPDYKPVDQTLDSYVFRGNASDKLAHKYAGAVAEGVIKVRKKLGWRNYADGGKVFDRVPNGKPTR
jgi:hypothetical protein